MGKTWLTEGVREALDQVEQAIGTTFKVESHVSCTILGWISCYLGERNMRTKKKKMK